MIKIKIIPLILAGGKGERFWPLSRREHPKQVLPILSENPLIYDSCIRLDEFEEIYLISNKRLYKKFFKTILPKKVKYIFEPMPKNTAPAIAWAAYNMYKKYGDCILFIDASDHYYKDVDKYLASVKLAAKYAEKYNKITLVGTTVNKPETGYGYIKIGNNLDKDFFKIEEFVEKPDYETAKEYMNSGNFFWNTSIILSKCSVMLMEFKKYMVKLYDNIIEAYEHKDDEEKLLNSFKKIEKTSISYELFPKSSEMALLRSDFEWDDVGDFNALLRINPVDENHNFAESKCFAFKSKMNYIRSTKPVVLLGVNGTNVIETDDLIFIANQNYSQKIKNFLPQVPRDLL